MGKFISALVLFILLSCKGNHSSSHVKRTYYDNGKLKKSYVLNDKNQKHGEFKVFHENGIIKEKCNYVNGKMHGPFFLWDDKGTLINTGRFTNGMQSDTSFYFDSTGKLEVYSILGKNAETRKDVYFQKNGKVKEIDIFYDGRKDLVSYKNFSEDGKVIQGFPNSKYALFKEVNPRELSVAFRGVQYANPDSIKVNYMKKVPVGIDNSQGTNSTLIESMTYKSEKDVRLFLKPQLYFDGKLIVQVEFFKTVNSVTRAQPFEFHFKEGADIPKSSLDTF